MAGPTTTATTTPAQASKQPAQGTLSPEDQAFLAQLQGGDTDKTPIGVGKDYKVHKETKKFADLPPGVMGPPSLITSTEDVAPQYFDGDQYGPATWPKDRVLQLQLSMKDAGLLTKAYRPGVWDQVSADAYEQAMGYANRSATNVDDVIKQWTQAPKPEDQKQGYVLTLKSPEDIKATLQASAAKVIGRSLSDGELATLVAGYQQLDRTAQEKAAAAAEVAKNDTQGTPIEVTDSPDISSYAADQLRQKYKGEADWVTANSRMNEFYSILGEGGGSSNG